ncbi:MAG: hypothetical protein M1536_04845, partial [Firmicutes bacterium]|nr:hypothetical protein [Bacillota bacterium]
SLRGGGEERAMIKNFRKNICKFFSKNEHFFLQSTIEYLLKRKNGGFKFFDILQYPIARLASLLIGNVAGTQIVPFDPEKKKILINREVAAGNSVLTKIRSDASLGKAEKIIITECYCRSKYKKCAAPVNNCIWFGEPVLLDHLNPVVRRDVTLKEVEEILEEAEKHGLVHQTVFVPDRQTVYCICNCCTCCCLSFRAPEVGYNAMQESGFVVCHDKTSCTLCGECITKCHFNAIEIKGKDFIIYRERCKGCGLCVNACVNNSLKLVEKQLWQ